MTKLPLIGDIGPLANGVRRGQLKRISSDFSQYGCLAVTIWLTSGEGFRLTSSMHDLTDGIEVGILRLEPLLHPQPDEASVDLPWSFRNGGSISKLVIEQRGTRAESGLLLRSRDGEEIIVVPATSLIASILAVSTHPQSKQCPNTASADIYRKRSNRRSRVARSQSALNFSRESTDRS